MRSGEEIRSALVKFAAKWGGYAGSENAEAQTFLNELFEAYGSNRQTVGARFEDFKSTSGFMDLHWPEVLIVEMKRPSVPVASAREQIHKYWRESADDAADRPAARWIVICNFHEFEVWEPGRFPTKPRLEFTLGQLPEKYDALMFLADTTVEPVFADFHRELTKDAAKVVSGLYESLADRAAAPIDEVQRFVLQAVWCLYAEKLHMLEGYPLRNIIEALRKDETRSPAAEIGHFFAVLNQKGNHNRVGTLAGTQYVNGDLFSSSSGIGLNRKELDLLFEASQFEWPQVDPTIFGSLLEGILGEERRAELGAHYTHESDIMKVVTPTIIRPWRARILAVETPSSGIELLDDLCNFKVLDPACGCGNFLYVAYREMRALEAILKERIHTVAKEKGLPVPAGTLPYYPLHNLHGLEIEPVAVQIARLTLWMGQRQMIDFFGPAEDPLPLVDMSSIQRADALAVDWPDVDVIVGNPPFHGSQMLREALGDDYIDWLKKQFGVGVKDLCVYWFRKAQDHLKPGQRAGLVGTKSVSQNRGRSASLDYIVASGGTITDAVSNQKWPGEAKVHVSIVNWVKGAEFQPYEFNLDGKSVSAINSSLKDEDPGKWTPSDLAENKNRCFQGPIPVGKGFIISDAESSKLLASDETNYRDVVRPYLTAADITDDPGQAPSRWIIDFASKPLEKASKFTSAFKIVRERVKPTRETVRRKGHRDKWWLFGEARVGMRRALAPLERYVAISAHSKRLNVTWQSAWTLPSNANMVVAVDDDYSMGILLSQTHESWAWHRSSTYKADLRYTPTTVFMTFPWPDPVTDVQREDVAVLSRAVIERRQEICKLENFGLTKLYNLMDEGGYADLKKLHKQLDEAVAACYGWPKSAAQDPAALVALLSKLNREIAEAQRPYNPFGK